MEGSTSESLDIKPMVIIVISKDRTQSRPFVYHTLEVKDLPSTESLIGEIVRLVNSSRSSSGGHEHIHSSLPPLSNKRKKARMWHEALHRKRNGAKMMLAAQQVIEEVEEEICLSVPRDTIDKIRSEFYDTGDGGDPAAETYIATVSAVRVYPEGLGDSESTSGDRDSSSSLN